MPTGNAAISGAGPGEMREARKAVRILDQPPAGATLMGTLRATRCHRNFLHEAPSPETVLDDLIVSAYAQGADVLTNVRQEREEGLAQNCWYLQHVVADVYSVE